MSRYKGKRVLIVGFGKSGASAAKYLVKQGASVTVTDLKQRMELADSLKVVGDAKIEYDLGRHSIHLFLSCDLIVVSPGVPLNIKPLEEAREKNIPITTEVEIAAVALKEPLVAVTGTNGKTTSTTLIGEMLKGAQRSCFVGGNIGTPLVDYVAGAQSADVVVAELSSFQLNLTERMVPAVAVFTNIGQDHLDRYPDMNAYIEAKKNLLRVCDRNSYVVLNYDDACVSQFMHENPGKLLWFTKRDPMSIGGEFAENFRGVFCDFEKREVVARITNQEERYDVSMFKLFGDHNKENLMAAICVARVMGVPPKVIQQVIASFPGVPHRLEYVRRINGVFFVNDSKSTNIMSLKRSLESFKKSPIVLIAGGKDKDMDFSPLKELVATRCKTLILIGEAKEKINRTLGDCAETYLMGTFEEAILLAYQKSRTGDVVLLSPGCASYDMFRNFEERGEYFKKIVQQH